MSISTFYDAVLHLSKTFSLPNFSYLSHHLPVFPVFSEQIKILSKPHEFYNELLSHSSWANKRIIMASLYVGTGKMEEELVATIFKQLQCYPKMKILWLLDYTRASRGATNSRTLLLPLIQNNSSCKVSLFHTPDLRGFTKVLLPERWNEIIGLQHMKIYVFDNSVILSGANLSNDYFVNRQDRYVVIRDCKELADFYEGLVSLLLSHSFQLRPDNTTKIEGNGSVHPYRGSRRQYLKGFTSSIRSFWAEELVKSCSRLKTLSAKTVNNEEKDAAHPDTLLLPTIQIPHCGIFVDSEATANFLHTIPEASRIHLATGYFNLTNQFADIILHQSNSRFNILCAHPKANGFLGARGFAGGIPAAYTNLCKQFYHKVVKNSLADRISVYEYQKDGWTFHAKGLWYFPPADLLPSATLIGSPNFGHRSVHRDLESHLFISTLSPSLRKEMAEEQDILYKSASLVAASTFARQDRLVPFWVKLVTRFFKYFF